MIFTTIGRVSAILIAVFGLLLVMMGMGVASGFLVEPEPGRYLGTKSSGETIDNGVYYILIGVFLGVASDISRSLIKLNSKNANNSDSAQST